MTDEFRGRTQPAPGGNWFAGIFNLQNLTLPGGAFAASLLLDLLSIAAAHDEQARSYRRGSADLLGLGLSRAVASLGLAVVDGIRAAPGGTTAPGTRKFAVDGALIAIYLLDLAARQREPAGTYAAGRRIDPLPVGLSLLGLTFAAISRKL